MVTFLSELIHINWPQQNAFFEPILLGRNIHVEPNSKDNIQISPYKKGDSMKKRNLVSEMKHSEVTATMEHLSRIGVEVDGLAKLRGKMPRAFERQLAGIINKGSFHVAAAMSTMEVFSACIGSPNIAELASNGGDERLQLLKAEPGAELYISRPERIPVSSVSHDNFIVLEDVDFAKMGLPKFRMLLTDEWLGKWSQDNLIGVTLELCHENAAVYLAPHCRHFLKKHMDQAYICSDPKKGEGCVFVMQNLSDGLVGFRKEVVLGSAPVPTGNLVLSYSLR